MHKAIILLREKEHSFLNATVSEQETKCKDYAKANNWEVAQEYIGTPWNKEDTLSLASDPIMHIKEAAEKGEIDTLLVYSFYCIGRQDIETPIAIQALLKMGVKVQSVTEGSFI